VPPANLKAPILLIFTSAAYVKAHKIADFKGFFVATTRFVYIITSAMGLGGADAESRRNRTSDLQPVKNVIG
jgi:hypothetical protein